LDFAHSAFERRAELEGLTDVAKAKFDLVYSDNDNDDDVITIVVGV